jgi:hypothetical protein
MTAIAKSGTPSITTAAPPTNCSISGLFAGEAINAGDACYIKTSDGKAYKSTGALVGTAPPDEPALTTATSGGTIVDGLYGVKITYVTAAGESLPSESSFITTKGASADQSTLTVASPAAATGATKYKVYITAKNGGPWKLQNTTGTNVGTGFTLSAPPATNTAEPPTTDTSGSHAASVVDGFAPEAAASGDAVSLYWNVRFAYGAALSPGSFVYLDETTAGALNDSPTTYGTVPVGRVVDATRIELFRSY